MLSTGVMVSVAICSPQPIVRAGLREILGREEPFPVLETREPLQQTIAWIQNTRPDILLYEVRSNTEALALLDALKRGNAHTRTIMLTEDFAEEFVISLFQQGAFGCLLKTASLEEVIKAINAVHAGELWLSRHFFAKVLNSRPNHGPETFSLLRPLTPRQHQIVELVCCGMSNKDIAARLLITEATVRAHVNDVFKKLGVRHRVQLAIHFARSDHSLTDAASAKFSN